MSTEVEAASMSTEVEAASMSTEPQGGSGRQFLCATAFGQVREEEEEEEEEEMSIIGLAAVPVLGLHQK
ncbi:hypothetical protein EYF80_059356 [Liparis tanakae]|uniref:Uncharacterized protein n=1 Tax=Liparis tanakae TaxID=230148 RepID=A0A4Z2EQ99_9TELE|nr:hypothetical protein EYF80_059356 [Liparis tanakae]